MVSTHYVLVHGASHGAWCWYKIRTLLEQAGHTATCLDLRSGGIDTTDPDTLFKFHDYNQPLLDFLASLPESEKVILVGHSMGGLNVTHALYKFATKLRAVVYLAAVMSTSGDKSSHFRVDMMEWGYGLGPDKPPTSMLLKKEYRRQFYYTTSPVEDCTLASMLLKPCPVYAVQDFKLPNMENEDIKKVPSIYIKTLKDGLMPSESQDAMIDKWPPSEVMTIESDHCAFFSNPNDLFTLLLDISSKYV